MLVRTNLIINKNYFISTPANHKPSSLHDDQDPTVENQHDPQCVQAIPEMTAKSAIGNHGDYGTIIIHKENYHDNEQDQIDSSHDIKHAIVKNECSATVEATSNAADRIFVEHDMIQSNSTFTTASSSSSQPQNDNESFQSTNLISYHGILSQKPVSSSLLESPIPSCIGSIDFKENCSFLTDDETINPPANLIYHKRREDFYPQKTTNQQQQKEVDTPPPALDFSRRQSIHVVLGKAVTKIYPKPASLNETGGMPVFKPSATYKKPKDIYRKIKTLVKHRK